MAGTPNKGAYAPPNINAVTLLVDDAYRLRVVEHTLVLEEGGRFASKYVLL